MNAIVTQRADEIKRTVCRVLEVEPGEVSETDLFVQDLGADSMKLIELLANLEVDFDVEIDPGEIDKMAHLKGVYEVLSAALDAEG